MRKKNRLVPSPSTGHKDRATQAKLAELGKLILRARQDRKWSVRQLSTATRGAVSPSYVYQIEGLSQSPRGRNTFKPSIETLYELAKALDLDFALLMDCAGYPLNERVTLVTKPLDMMRRMSDEMRKWQLGYLILTRSEEIKFDLPWPNSPTLNARIGDHILFLIPSDAERELALQVLRLFVEDGLEKEESVEACIVLSRDHELRKRLKRGLEDLPKKNNVEDVEEVRLNQRLLYRTLDDTKRFFPQKLFTREGAKQLRDNLLSALLKLRKTEGLTQRLNRHFRCILEDADRFLCFLGSPGNIVEPRRAWLQYESTLHEDLNSLSYRREGNFSEPIKPPVVICHYILDSDDSQQSLSKASFGELTLAELLLRLLRAHDQVWFLTPGPKASEEITRDMILTGRDAVRWILEEYLLKRPISILYRGFWEDLRHVLIKHGVF